MGRESAIVLTARNRAFLTRRSHSLARQAARLLHPRDELRFVTRVILVDVPIAHGPMFRRPGRNGIERCSAKECHFDVPCEAVKAEKPAVAFDTIEGRVPFD